MSDTLVTDDAAQQRYELATPDGPAFAAYQRAGDVTVFTHTVVPPAQRGHGVAGTLIAGALADVRRRGGRIVAECPYVVAYLERHPAERDLLVR